MRKVWFAYVSSNYPILPNDAFARHVLVRAREMVFNDRELLADKDPGLPAAISAAEIFYR